MIEETNFYEKYMIFHIEFKYYRRKSILHKRKLETDINSLIYKIKLEYYLKVGFLKIKEIYNFINKYNNKINGEYYIKINGRIYNYNDTYSLTTFNNFNNVEVIPKIKGGANNNNTSNTSNNSKKKNKSIKKQRNTDFEGSNKTVNSSQYIIDENGNYIRKYDENGNLLNNIINDNLGNFVENPNIDINKYDELPDDAELPEDAKKAGGILRMILNFILKIFDPIIKPLKMIATVFVLLLKGIMFMISGIIWMISLIIWTITVFIPSIPGDIYGLLKKLFYVLYYAIIDVFVSIFRYGFNYLGNMTIGAIYGWDNVEYIRRVEELEKQKNSNNTFKNTSNNKFENTSKSSTSNNSCNKDNHLSGKKYYKTDDNTLPISVVILTVLCPPIGVFMEYGLLGWFNILVCALLTLAFYFPGLIYALILLYC
jgi:uncharacterized membrane protein YqaE (UPF0057 family)